MTIKKFLEYNLILVLVLLVGGCQLFAPNNVETVVSVTYLRYWYLFPNGDYLIYSGSVEEGNYLVNLATKKNYKFDCGLHWWDNHRFGCYQQGQVSVVDVKTLTKIPLVSIDLTKNEDISIEPLLSEAEIIYRPEWISNTIYILASDYQLNTEKNYVINGFTNTDELLQNHNYIFIPTDYPKNSKSPVTSPNGLYYYDFTDDGFAIFTTDKNEIVAEFTSKEAIQFEIGGWEVDSSGVYFHPHRFGLGRRESPQKILKLTIPDE